jgi:glutathione S-transferase
MLRIYGIPRSRTFRTLWMAGELEIPYESVATDFTTGANRTPDYLAINPNGFIPSIDDDGFKLWESMAINLYLAKKYGAAKGLYPTRLEDEARAWQWSFWGVTTVERPVLTAMFNRALYPEAKRDAAAADQAERDLQAPLQVLDGALGTPYLLGGEFTVADLNLASILAWARPARIDFAPFPRLADWARRCADRPAARAVRDLQR